MVQLGQNRTDRRLKVQQVVEYKENKQTGEFVVSVSDSTPMGWIDCESKPGEGSTFSVFLPVSVEESAQSARPPVEQPPPRTTRPVTETILLVENEDTVRRTITLMLRRVVYKVLESSNGKEGLEVLSREPSAIDLILLDLSMAMVSGEDVLEELFGHVLVDALEHRALDERGRQFAGV